jgi:branched-chain amino acid transport system ATP-binding protein
MFLELKNVSVSFQNFQALNQVSFSVKKNSVHGIIGPNGAGKTTCFKAISGETKYGGEIFFQGKSLSNKKPHEIARLLLFRSFQVPSLFPSLSLYEHFKLVGTQNSVDEILSSYKLLDRKNQNISQMPHGVRRLSELALLQSLKPQLLILDEPSSGIGSQEFHFLLTQLKELSKITTLLIIEHDMRFIESLCDTVTVLNRGEVLAQSDYKTIAASKEVKNIYLGHD